MCPTIGPGHVTSTVMLKVSMVEEGPQYFAKSGRIGNKPSGSL